MKLSAEDLESAGRTTTTPMFSHVHAPAGALNQGFGNTLWNRITERILAGSDDEPFRVAVNPRSSLEDKIFLSETNNRKYVRLR
ncbi:UNVERIFIED_CONTAM: hypothetical protein HHA_450000 [Hammondia hammondi]|eukprot:XP_008882677.1 hypothetical protein HHA_450000 [Hammondia hammondi]